MRRLLTCEGDAWMELMDYIDNLFKRDHMDCAFKLFVNIILDHFLNTKLPFVHNSIRFKLGMYAKIVPRDNYERKLLKLSNCLSVSKNGISFTEGIEIYNRVQKTLKRLKKLKAHAHLVGFCCLALNKSLMRARERIFWSPGNTGFFLARYSFHANMTNLSSRQRSRSPRRI